MKNLIIQYYIDINLYSQPMFNGITSNIVERYSEFSFKKYCAKFGHDFLRITKPAFHYKHPTWERFDLWFNSKWLDKYDQVLYVDTDVFALDHAPDIFAQYNNPTTFKSPVYRKYRNNSPALIKSKFNDTILKDCDPKKVSDTFFQTGVWMLTKQARDKMMPWVERYMEFDGQCDDGQFLNWAVIESGVEYQDMDPMFNVKNNGLKKTWKYEDTNFLHSAGGDKYHTTSKIHSFLREKFPAVNPNV
jgi:hypothetical protein